MKSRPANAKRSGNDAGRDETAEQAEPEGSHPN